MRFLYCAIWLAVPTAMHAHHGPGQFDSSQSVEVTGAVTDVRFVNPHGYCARESPGEENAMN